MLRIIAGTICFFFFVAQPIRANLIASVATHYPLVPQDRAMLFSHATEIDPCNVDVLHALGDSYVLQNNSIMGAVNYGKAMACSPGSALYRFKFGQMLFASGFDGMDNIKDALRLEPNNPIYQDAYIKLSMARPQQSQ